MKALTTVVVGLSCLIVGVLGTLCLIREHGLNQKPRGTTPDSPVVVRGGSVISHGDVAWQVTPTNSHAYMTSVGNGHTASILDLDFVDQTKKNQPKRVTQINMSQNWIITLTYRKLNPKLEDQSATLQICTEMNNSYTACLQDNTPPTDKVYLLDQYAVGTFQDEVIDRGGGVRFDLNNCNGVKAGPISPCNHPFALNLAAGATQASYQCVDGACEINIHD